MTAPDSNEEDDGYIVEELEWGGVVIEVTYAPDYLDNEIAHLQLRSLAPHRAELPVTETGYRSHFLAAGIVEAEGGPLAYARAWLDEAATCPSWRERESAARQYSLF